MPPEVNKPDPELELREEKLRRDADSLRRESHGKSEIHSLLLEAKEIRLDLVQQDRSLKKISLALFGNEDQPERGIVIRLDRVERQILWIVRLGWVLITALISAGVFVAVGAILWSYSHGATPAGDTVPGMHEK